MRSTFDANFLLRKNRISKDGLTTIDLVITVNTERVRINLGKKIDPLKFAYYTITYIIDKQYL